MQLTQLKYTDTNWEITDLELETANLLVGENAAGKSRTLGMIDLLYKMITQKRDLNWGGRWELLFKNHYGEFLEYNFSISTISKGVTHEQIKLNGQDVLQRFDPMHAKLFNKLTGQHEDIYPPKDKLVIHTNRDVKKYPFLEQIANWAEQSFGFKFGNLNSYAHISMQEYDFLSTVEDIPTLFIGFGKKQKENIIKSMNEVGYNVTNLSCKKASADIPIIFVEETDVQKPIPHYKLSQGMFRTLAMLVFIEHLLFHKKPATIIIDDLCEGLDYNKAAKLGKMVFDISDKNGIQIIATSNDSFLMDVVDIQYWNILYRKGKTVKTINKRNHPELFDNFKFTGLSNFDFFASDYITQALKNE